MASLLYPDLFRSLESVRWNMEKDVPWGKFDASLLSDEQARKYYEANQSRYQEPEQRKAAHILIKVNEGSDAKTREAAKAKAEQLLAEIRKAPAKTAAPRRRATVGQEGRKRFTAGCARARRPPRSRCRSSRSHRR